MDFSALFSRENPAFEFAGWNAQDRVTVFEMHVACERFSIPHDAYII